MTRVPPSLLLTIWMIGFALTGILDIMAPAFLGSFFVWGSGAGWQREAGLWNICAAFILQVVIRSRARDIQRGLLPLLAILSLLFAANHLIALLVAPSNLAHWAQVVFYGTMGSFGLSSAVLGDLASDARSDALRSKRPFLRRLSGNRSTDFVELKRSSSGSGSPESLDRGRKISEAVASMKRRSKKPKPIEIKPSDDDFE